MKPQFDLQKTALSTALPRLDTRDTSRMSAHQAAIRSFEDYIRKSSRVAHGNEAASSRDAIASDLLGPQHRDIPRTEMGAKELASALAPILGFGQVASGLACDQCGETHSDLLEILRHLKDAGHARSAQVPVADAKQWPDNGKMFEVVPESEVFGKSTSPSFDELQKLGCYNPGVAAGGESLSIQQRQLLAKRQLEIPMAVATAVEKARQDVRDLGQQLAAQLAEESGEMPDGFYSTGPFSTRCASCNVELGGGISETKIVKLARRHAKVCVERKRAEEARLAYRACSHGM
jgi:hypothetical protein